MKPYAAKIVDALNSNEHLRPIVPSVAELQEAIPFSTFLVGAIAKLNLHQRGANEVDVVGDTKNRQQQPTPWNLDQDPLSEAARNEWLVWERVQKTDESNRRKVRPSRNVLEVRVSLKQKFRIVGHRLDPKQRLSNGEVQRACTLGNAIDPNHFGKIIVDVFPGLESTSHATYYNLERIPT